MRPRPSARTLALLQQARLPLVEGMMLCNGHRIVQVDAGGGLRLGDVRHDQAPMLLLVAGTWRWLEDDRPDPLAVPDPGDRGTWMLLLDELGRRRAVDTRDGARLVREEGGWRLIGATEVGLGMAEVGDPMEALAGALLGDG